MDDLLQEFIAETRETLEALAGEIVAWEANPGDGERLDAIFRFVHTVKGSCGFLDLPRLARLSHAAEDVLASARSGERAPDTALVNAVLAIVDRIGEIVEAIDAGAALDDTGEELLIAALERGGAATAPASAPAGPRVASRSVRLNVDLLDRMMGGMSDMVLARNELARRMRDLQPDPALEAALDRLSLTVGDMRSTVTRTRMQRIEALFSPLPRMIRDTAAELGKSVTLHIEGSDVELDREMIELMRDPLVHAVRNAIDHGIEAPAARRAAGKNENGRLIVSARQSGNHILIEVADDGQGIDVDRLLAKVATSGRRSAAALAELSAQEKLDLVFEPGLSVRDVVTGISGRGVGMDVVRANVEHLGGRIELHNQPGQGLRVVIQVPLTLSIIATIGVAVGAQRFAISRQVIDEIIAADAASIRFDKLGGAATVTVRDRRMPLVGLADVLAMASDGPGAMLVVLNVPGGRYALATAAVLDHEELVVKPAAPAVMASGLYAGQTLPDSGLPMLLLDASGIAAAAGLSFDRLCTTRNVVAPVEEAEPSALLFRDLDGQDRLVALEAVERIERIAGAAITFCAGALRLSVGDRLIPLAAIADPQERQTMSVLRLRDGRHELAYAIVEAVDIVAMPGAMVPARLPGPIAGAAIVDEVPIEVLDLHWLFAHHAHPMRGDEAICLLTGSETGWLTTFLKPMIEAAGYRAALTLAPGEHADLILTTDADDRATARLPADTPVIRLSSDADAKTGQGIDRYDRAGIAAALAQTAGARA